MLYETFVRVLFAKPWLLFLMIPWLIKGKANLKRRLAANCEIAVETLPYREELLTYLGTKGNCKIILCTATDQILAEKIAAHLGIFSEVIGSTKNQNLVGSAKAQALKERFGAKGFSYVGNEFRDLKIWADAASAVVIGGNSLAKKAASICKVEKHIRTEEFNPKVVFKACRIHQWVKNALILVPLITSHQIADSALTLKCLIAFIAFGLCASATYLINDLSDLESDRKHTKKRFRPLASGSLSIRNGMIISFALLSAAGLMGYFVNEFFLGVLAGYTCLTLMYSFYLKRLQTIDIITLATLYTVRIIAGGVATSIAPSFWLLGFSMFVFLSLAIVKRISEILKTFNSETQQHKISGRGYYLSDIDILRSLATASGMVSILVFSMYIQSTNVTVLYSSPTVLWAVCPVFAYWMMRILIMASRGEIDEDPISFTLKDYRSWLAASLIAAVIFLAI